MATQINFEDQQLGYNIIADAITNSITHIDYKRVTSLHKLYNQLITGKDIEALLKQFVRREDDSLFNQRKELTQSITPSVSATIMNPFYKVGRSNNIIKKWVLNNVDNPEEVTKKIGTAVLGYNGDRSLDSYLETRFVEVSFTDPNSFIITEFDTPKLGEKGEILELVKPRPFECSCENAINYYYDNNILKWLLVKLPYKYKQGEKIKDGYTYTIYFDNISIKFTQIDEATFAAKENGFITGTRLVNESIIDTLYFNAGKDKLFVVETFEHKSGQVPAVRVGYKRDLQTEGRTCVSPLHEALPYFFKTIKTVSEFDLTMALHAFPQKFQYVGRCSDKECSDGLYPDGNKCSSCKGSGMQEIHTSAQDAVVMRLPKKGDELWDLQKLVNYVYPPIELLAFQKEFINELEIKARKAVFNSEVFSKNEIVQTATEAKISMDSVYDTLYPFAEKYSSVYRMIVKVISELRDVKGLEVIHKFPKDFKFKTMDELLAELKVANESSAPGYIRAEISMDIAEQQFIDKPEELSRIKVKQKFYPFQDKSKEEILYIISNNKTTKYNEILYAHFDQIFNDLDLIEDNFYQMTYEKQKLLVQQKVQEIIDIIDQEAPSNSLTFNGFNQQDNVQ